MIRCDGIIDICKDYNLKKYSSASSIVENVKQAQLKDRKLRDRINELSKNMDFMIIDKPFSNLCYTSSNSHLFIVNWNDPGYSHSGFSPIID